MKILFIFAPYVIYNDIKIRIFKKSTRNSKKFLKNSWKKFLQKIKKMLDKKIFIKYNRRRLKTKIGWKSKKLFGRNLKIVGSSVTIRD